jgi:PRTRC genetic system protein C
MVVTVQRLERTFLFNGAKLPAPNPEFSVEQVRDMFVNTYPELATAAIEGPTPVSGAMQYVFSPSAKVRLAYTNRPCSPRVSTFSGDLAGRD